MQRRFSHLESFEQSICEALKHLLQGSPPRWVAMTMEPPAERFKTSWRCEAGAEGLGFRGLGLR